jgi:hypothetical protein
LWASPLSVYQINIAVPQVPAGSAIQPPWIDFPGYFLMP